MAFKTKTPDVRKEVDENHDEGITFTNRGVRQILRQKWQRPQENNDFKINDDRYYYCEKPAHLKQNCYQQRRRNNQRNEDPKTL